MKEMKTTDLPQLWTAISHEIRTPLNVIKGMTDISENEVYDVGLMKDCLAKIKESTNSMQTVVNSLVDYAAISQRKVEIQKEKLDFKTLITEVAMHSYLLAKRKNCHFNMHVQEVTEEALIGDEARISQVLMTMLNVVVRYTSSEGVIDFTVQQTGISNAKVFIRFALRSTALQFPEEIAGYLNNNSLYMNPELLSPVGTFGIAEMNALYISYLMGGKIKAHNKDGDYSEIIFDMEFGRTEQPYSLNSGKKIFAHQRILIVADSLQICEERGKMLVDMGMQFESATECDETLEKIGQAENEKRPFTICIIDWEMEKCRKILQNIRDIFGQSMTIIVTAHDPSNLQKKAEKYGADYVIDRTIFRSTLFDALISIEKGIQFKREIEKQEIYDFTGNRILVAEDVALNMEVVTKLLSRVNIEVTCVENGREAVMQFEKKPVYYYNAILLDINMPVMDGYEATERIRNSQKADARKIPIFAMTANAFKEDVEKALEAGMNGHIAKPIDVNALYRILNRILNRREESELEQLRDLVEQDPLTGCLNRRGFDARIADLESTDIPIAYISIDIDDFKLVNDHFGHETGDMILKKVVQILKKKFRATDCFVRLGGDEFVVVLIDYHKQESFIIRRIEEINEELLCPTDDLPPVTISAGAVISLEGYKEELYTNADKALYKSKSKGKGICTVFDNFQHDMFEEESVEQVLYTETTHYMNAHLKVIVNRKSQLNSLLMIKNKPVGFATGFYEEDFPLYTFNGFLPGLLGYTVEEFQSAALAVFSTFLHEDDISRFLSDTEEEKISEERVRISNKAGDYLWFNVEYILTQTKDHRCFWMASFKNIDDHLVGSLCAEDYRLVAIIDQKKDSVIIEKGAFMGAEKGLHLQKKYHYSSLIADATMKTVKESEREEYLEKASLFNVCNRINMGGGYEFTVYQKWGNADYYAVRHKYRYMSEKKDQILCTWEILSQMAELDELTDALNENGFYRAVENKIKNGSKEEKYEILYFNISGFKAWNSMIGKELSDELLKMVVRKLTNSELKPIAVARLFSDYFVCLITEDHYNLEVISQLCNSHFEIENKSIIVQMRCGIYEIEDDNEPIRSMCDKAKLAKSMITNEYAVPYHVFDKGLNQKYVQQQQVLNQVEHALERKEIKVFYQPVVDVETGKIVSAEALIRWVLPGEMIMSPLDFIPALERQGRIAEVDIYAQNTVKEMLQRRKTDKKEIVPVSVNVSRMDFLSDKFIDNLNNTIFNEKIAKEYMRIEVTESSYMEIGKIGEELLKNLREQGIKILMDDFGTGVSTLSGIISHQFDIVKIDMSFIRGLGKKNGSEAVVENVIAMCHALQIKAVAEGVETEEQYQFLKKVGCDYIQGYYFYKPMPEEEFEKVLDEK